MKLIAKICSAAALLGFMIQPALAQKAGVYAKDGGISAEMLKEISKGYSGSAYEKAVKNALSKNSITVLASNAENVDKLDDHFSDRVRTKGITDQQRSGRCWLFTGLNVLRAEMIDKYDLGDFQFSQAYMFFYDQLEKSNLFLQGVIDTKDKPFDDREVDWLFSHPLSDGGQFTGVSNLIMKYGVVPAEAMPETYSSNNTRDMAFHLRNKLREDGLILRQTAAEAGKKLNKKKAAKLNAKLISMKTDMLKDIYHILAVCMGVPPQEFEWTRYNSKGDFVSRETYTPQSFYKEFLGEDLENNYVMIMNDPVREYNKVYEIKYDRHVYDGENWLYLNLPMDEIKKIATASIKDNKAMYFSCDVGKFSSRETGFLDLNNFDYESLLGVKFGMNKEERVKTHASGSTHAMTLIAVDIRDGKPVKWMVENSWGKKSGHNGYMIMTDQWFDEYMFRVVVNKKYIPANILKFMDQKPIELPAWDPMFAPEN